MDMKDYFPQNMFTNTIELKMNGKLDEVLKKLCEIGHKNQWK